MVSHQNQHFVLKTQVKQEIGNGLHILVKFIVSNVVNAFAMTE